MQTPALQSVWALNSARSLTATVAFVENTRKHLYTPLPSRNLRFGLVEGKHACGVTGNLFNTYIWMMRPVD